MLKYTIVFVLTSTSKYAYIRYHRICMEICSYLTPGLVLFRLENLSQTRGEVSEDLHRVKDRFIEASNLQQNIKTLEKQ